MAKFVCFIISLIISLKLSLEFYTLNMKFKEDFSINSSKISTQKEMNIGIIQTASSFQDVIFVPTNINSKRSVF